MRRPAPPGRIDVVVDRDPDADTDVTVYLDGAKVTGSRLAVHVVDPGAGGPDHEWFNSTTTHAADVPEAVADEIDSLAQGYHDRHACRDARCRALPLADDRTADNLL
ncbi:hypothetical protein [Streptomyces marianii]|uniref:hypothetical protein n=1 Tax=Streptomyces marianii TaxID=1817406 RepID=UPI0018F8C224|nr:hypothetical protein [Streptomyces marianii]